MSRSSRWLLLVVLAGGVSAGAVVWAQSPASQQAPKPKADDANKNDKQLYKELATPYKKWLDDIVPYIISDDERKLFLKLQTNEEREEYIEAFWQRRNPDQDSPDNAFKEEHFRRIAYANEHYGAGIQGWRSDRGRMYIMWGPPTSKESHTNGDYYQRPLEQGGGDTKTYAWETWNYNYLEGMGRQDVTLEFVDPSGTNEFHLTSDPSEKDAFLNTPLGLTLAEQSGDSTKADRFFNANDGSRIAASAMGGAQPRSLNEFERLELYAAAFTPPPVKYKDLEALVSTRVVRDQLNFTYQSDFLRITDDTALVPITVQIPHQEMTYQSRDGVHRASINLFARVSTLTGRVVQTFETEIQSDIPDTLLAQSMKQSSITQKSMPLKSGLYRLDIVLKDTGSGDVGVKNLRLAVPPFEEEKLTGSSLILADEMTPVATREIGLGQFVIGSTKVRPKIDKSFHSNQPIGIFLQMYGLKVDETTHKNNATVELEILQGEKSVFQAKQTSAEMDQNGEQVTFEKILPSGALQPGKYKLQIHATDTLANQTLLRCGAGPCTTDFTVTPADPPPTQAQASPGR
jgi:GWxTD domain-containing protein